MALTGNRCIQVYNFSFLINNMKVYYRTRYAYVLLKLTIKNTRSIVLLFAAGVRVSGRGHARRVGGVAVGPARAGARTPADTVTIGPRLLQPSVHAYAGARTNAGARSHRGESRHDIYSFTTFCCVFQMCQVKNLTIF